MKRRSLTPYTILIARSGKAPLTLTVQPIPVLASLAVAVMIPSVWLGTTIYALNRSNHDLAQRNDHLTEAADQVLEDLEVLDAEIQNLRERAGLPEVSSAPRVNAEAEPRGGVGSQLEAESLFSVAKSRLPQISAQLHSQVKPALTETLEEEEARKAARPTGMPLKLDVRISSEFGPRRNPFGGGYEQHNGIDFPGPQGTPIHVTAPGTVETADWSGGYGYHVIVDHGYGYRTLYAHLSSMAVAQGDLVERDRVIGYLGSTGRSSGPHLHYTVYRDREAVDPKRYLTPSLPVLRE